MENVVLPSGIVAERGIIEFKDPSTGEMLNTIRTYVIDINSTLYSNSEKFIQIASGGNPELLIKFNIYYTMYNLLFGIAEDKKKRKNPSKKRRIDFNLETLLHNPVFRQIVPTSELNDSSKNIPSVKTEKGKKLLTKLLAEFRKNFDELDIQKLKEIVVYSIYEDFEKEYNRIIVDHLFNKLEQFAIRIQWGFEIPEGISLKNVIEKNEFEKQFEKENSALLGSIKTILEHDLDSINEDSQIDLLKDIREIFEQLQSSFKSFQKYKKDQQIIQFCDYYIEKINEYEDSSLDESFDYLQKLYIVLKDRSPEIRVLAIRVENLFREITGKFFSNTLNELQIKEQLTTPEIRFYTIMYIGYEELGYYNAIHEGMLFNFLKTSHLDNGLFFEFFVLGTKNTEEHKKEFRFLLNNFLSYLRFYRLWDDLISDHDKERLAFRSGSTNKTDKKELTVIPQNRDNSGKGLGEEKVQAHYNSIIDSRLILNRLEKICTNREMEIINMMLVLDCNDKQIAQLLDISPPAVMQTKKRIRNKIKTDPILKNILDDNNINWSIRL